MNQTTFPPQESGATRCVRHGFEHETLDSKIESHLRLKPEDRFFQALEMMVFLRKLNPNQTDANDYPTDRTVQIVKST